MDPSEPLRGAMAAELNSRRNGVVSVREMVRTTTVPVLAAELPGGSTDSVSGRAVVVPLLGPLLA